MFNTGQVTLPKKWRDKFKVQNFIAKETDEGLLIQPLKEQSTVEYYENEEEFGLVFPQGIDPQVLIDKCKEIDG